MTKLSEYELNEINHWLRERYGMFDTAYANWRIVWSNDQKEYRKGEFHEYAKNGDLVRIVSGTRYVPKYTHIKNRYVLERMIPVPETNKELVTKTSYEPVWTFEDKKGNPLPPVIGACFWIIEGVHFNAAMSVGAKYQDPRADKYWKEMKEEEKKKLYDQLFGNETPVTDALMQHSAVTVPDMSAVNGDNS